MAATMSVRRGALAFVAVSVSLALAGTASMQTRLAAPVPRISSTVPWSGQIQCQLEVQAEGYTSRQTHTWTLTGGAPRGTGDVIVHPAQWSVTGEGSARLDRVTQTTTARWTVTVPPMDAALNIVIARDTGALLLNAGGHSQLRVYKAYSGTREIANRGERTTSLPIDATVFEWQFPAIRQPATGGEFSGSMPVTPPNDLAPFAPPGARSTGMCSWRVGPAAAGAAALQSAVAPTVTLSPAGTLATPIVAPPTTNTTAPSGKAATTDLDRTTLKSAIAASLPDVALSQKLQSGGTTLTVVNGVPLGFALTATNRGTVATSGAVTVKDTLHPGLVYQSSSDTRCAAAGSTITCTAPSLAPSASTSFTINVVVANTAAASGTMLRIDNVATASTSNDANASNDSSNLVTVTVVGPNVPMLFVDNRINANGLTDSTYARIGDPVRYYFNLRSLAGSATATAPVAIRDQLDPRLTFVPHSVDTRTDARCSASGQLVTCTRATALAAGPTDSDTFEIIVKPNNAAALTPYLQPITNEVTASAANLPQPASGFGQTSIRMFTTLITASVSIVRPDGTALSTGSVRNGNTMTFRVSAGYDGFNSSIPPPVLTDILPPQLTFVPNSVDSHSDSRCVASGQTVTCTYVPLNYGLNPFFDILVRASDAAAQTRIVHASNRVTATMPGIPAVSKDITFDILPPGTPLSPYSGGGLLSMSVVDAAGTDWGVSVGFQSITGYGVVASNVVATRPPAPAGYSLVSNEYEIVLAPSSVATGPFWICIPWMGLMPQDRMWAYDGTTPLGDVTDPNGSNASRRCGYANRLTRFVIARPNP